MKKKYISILFLLLVLCLFSCDRGEKESTSVSGIPEPYPQDNDFDRNNFDNLGGNKEGKEIERANLDRDYYKYSSIEDFDQLEGPIYNVDLSNLDSISIEGLTYSNNILEISQNGKYILSGTLNGTLQVDDSSDMIEICLNGATIKTLDTMSSAGIVFKKTDSKRVLSIQSGTTNNVSDSVGDTDEDGDSAAIQGKKCSLYIIGDGKLNINAIGENSTGIKVKNSLYIKGCNIEINSNNNGIKADNLIMIEESNLDINSNGDGIKTDIEPETSEDVEYYTSHEESGCIYISNSDLNIVSLDDGISANYQLYIKNESDNNISIVTNNGCPERITEQTSDSADGKGIKVDGITFNDIDYKSTLERNYCLIIDGGNYVINSNDDAISSKGNLVIDDGNFEIKSGDDGIHSEYITRINNAEIDILNSYEGIEGAIVEILDGNISVISQDDGINAANSDLVDFFYYIYISGGDIFINANGDGIDSNGTIGIYGGKTIVYGPVSNGDSAIDSDSGILVYGGELIAFGSSGMVESPSSNSKQTFLVVNLNNSTKEAFVISDSNSEQIINVTPTKVYQSVIISTTRLISEQAYHIVVGSEEYDLTINGISNSVGNRFTTDGRPVRPDFGDRPR